MTTAPAETSSGTIARAALLLRVMAELPGEAALSTIAARMRLPNSTTHRLLNLLMEEGFVERGQSAGSYRVGLEFVRLAGLVISRAEVSERAQEFMQAVVDACDETCMLSLYVPRTRTTMITKVIHGSHPLRYDATTYVPGSPIWGATGRGILAYLPDDMIDAVLASDQTPSASGGKTPKPQQIKRELAHIRTQGYAHTHGQRIAGAVGFSAPIFASHGVVAALCVTVPESRFKPSMESRIASALKKQAAHFSATLGWRPA
jgi:DNA-binding IclR family transcriptional regulator